MRATTKPDRNSTQSDEIISRIRQLISMRGEGQGAFARSIGVDPTNMSKHMSGRLPITDGLINRIAVDLGVSKSWLLTGVGSPYAKQLHTDFISAPSSRPNASQEGTPIYDIDVVAGTSELSQMFTEDRIIGHMSLPSLRRDSVIVRVSGDSMEPVISPGAYISINPQSDIRNILWGQIYVIVMEDFRLVKYLRKSDNPEKVRLLSANPAYDEMIVDRRDILALYLVEAIINYNLRC
ncbi:MAG: LexA family transcriptional regulator [Barnesiella sp.]|nr:LexA family transcriptional regulator [Barnesiella sp.]MBD5376294.1 LexA family transcriptional regulator [Bacteroides sp.]